MSTVDYYSTVLQYLLAMGRYGPGVTYTVPRMATINAPPPMGPLGGLMGDPGASFSKHPSHVDRVALAWSVRSRSAPAVDLAPNLPRGHSKIPVAHRIWPGRAAGIGSSSTILLVVQLSPTYWHATHGQYVTMCTRAQSKL